MATPTSYSQLSFKSPATTIDLTQDDDNSFNSPRLHKRIRIDDSNAWSNVNKPQIQHQMAPPAYYHPSHFAVQSPAPSMFQPAFAQPVFQQQPRLVPNPYLQTQSRGPVIDLTGSPSPPPHVISRPLPEDLPQKTPVCIGQLSVTALILYPVDFLRPKDSVTGETEWASVRLQYEHNPHNPEKQETIHIKTPGNKVPGGNDGENFAVVEQKVATYLGPMLGKGLIRLDAKVRKGGPHLPILPLQMLVYTPKGNIDVVGRYLRQCSLLLDNPSPPYNHPRLTNYHYYNPHHPPPGGHPRIPVIVNRYMEDQSRWANVQGKTVDVQRSQVEEVFKSLKDEDTELPETEATPDIATVLYPHQKKALTFLLEREREQPRADGTFSSLWQRKINSMTHAASWFHAVTQKEVFKQPTEAKGSILADDMGLGKTITCVSLMASTLSSAKQFAVSPLAMDVPMFPDAPNLPDAAHFSGRVWGMPEIDPNLSAKNKAKAQRAQEKMEAQYTRASRIKIKSRATLILCPLSTVSNWEDQFRDHWKGEVSVVGGGGTSCAAAVAATNGTADKSDQKPRRVRQGTPLRVYVYHGNARRPDPAFLADFDAVITTYATLASEYSKQNRSLTPADADDDDEGSSEGAMEVDAHGNGVLKLPKPKKLKRKMSGIISGATEATSALQSVHWFRVVLDEAHSIKETGTVASRASCDLMADRRLCLTGTPVQNKLDDLFALIKFLRLEPLDDKTTWTEYIGTPVKFQQPLGVARLQSVMKCITLRRTKESKTQNGARILDLPPRRDELRYLKFNVQEQGIYDQFFNESKAEFEDLTDKNEVMKNYVGILQKILRLRQICDHFELVEGKGLQGDLSQEAASYESIMTEISQHGLNFARATAVFNILRESATTQCVECGGELCTPSDGKETDLIEDATPKRPRKGKPSSRAPTRANSPSTPRPVLTRCQHLFCSSCYRNCICPSWPDVPPETLLACSVCQSALGPTDAIEIRPDAPLDGPTTKKKAHKKEKRQKGQSLENFNPSTKIKALLGDLIQFSRANPHSNNYDANSVDIQMVDKQGNELDDGIVKTVVFSQWTSMLDKIEDALEAANIQYERLDGTMKREERTRAMDALKYEPACEVLLVSLKAGGVGLNLTAAQRVYLMDPYWNPAVENQAVDRIHRLGQTRPVTTIKLIIENSIEARLLEVQKKKTDLANMTLGGGNFSKSELMARRMEELNQLFG